MNRGGVGARSLNIELQAALNPAGERKVERFGWTFAPGDKVMQIENDYDKEVYNGDIGYVQDVEPDDGELTASFDGRSVTYGFGELDALVPAYAAGRRRWSTLREWLQSATSGREGSKHHEEVGGARRS
jgi:exodeoxyribonuclease V alpha subunit